MDQTKLDEFFKIIAFALKEANISNLPIHSLRIRKWMEENAPQYLK